MAAMASTGRGTRAVYHKDGTTPCRRDAHHAPARVEGQTGLSRCDLCIDFAQARLGRCYAVGFRTISSWKIGVQ
jgi:hypothetical protein